VSVDWFLNGEGKRGFSLFLLPHLSISMPVAERSRRVKLSVLLLLIKRDDQIRFLLSFNSTNQILSIWLLRLSRLQIPLGRHNYFFIFDPITYVVAVLNTGSDLYHELQFAFRLYRSSNFAGLGHTLFFVVWEWLTNPDYHLLAKYFSLRPAYSSI